MILHVLHEELLIYCDTVLGTVYAVNIVLSA